MIVWAQSLLLLAALVSHPGNASRESAAGACVQQSVRGDCRSAKNGQVANGDCFTVPRTFPRLGAFFDARSFGMTSCTSFLLQLRLSPSPKCNGTRRILELIFQWPAFQFEEEGMRWSTGMQINASDNPNMYLPSDLTLDGRVFHYYY